MTFIFLTLVLNDDNVENHHDSSLSQSSIVPGRTVPTSPTFCHFLHRRITIVIIIIIIIGIVIFYIDWHHHHHHPMIRCISSSSWQQLPSRIQECYMKQYKSSSMGFFIFGTEVSHVVVDHVVSHGGQEWATQWPSVSIEEPGARTAKTTSFLRRNLSDFLP